MNPEKNLAALRAQIDQIDQQITQLIEQRMTVVEQIASHKKQEQAAVRDPKREQIVLEQVACCVKNPAYTASIVATFEDILAHSRAYQENHLKK